MASKMDEIILVAPRSEVFENETLIFQGIEAFEDTVDKITENLAITYSTMRRGDAEDDPTYKQPIPYAVLKKGDEVFAYRRLSGGGEARLHNQISLGVGGHVNAIDGLSFGEIIKENLKRELEEELYIGQEDFNVNVIGLINDDENEVGKVHIGLLAVIELNGDTEVSVRETDQLEGFWLHLDELQYQDIYNSLESWSKFVADIL
jgi:predicted NUDIX family phosphoesterase